MSKIEMDLVGETRTNDVEAVQVGDVVGLHTTFGSSSTMCIS
jgi:hypothetical protein